MKELYKHFRIAVLQQKKKKIKSLISSLCNGIAGSISDVDFLGIKETGLTAHNRCIVISGKKIKKAAGLIDEYKRLIRTVEKLGEINREIFLIECR